MNKKLTITVAASALVLALAGCGAASTTGSAALPQEKTTAPAAVATKAPVAAPVAKPAAPVKPAPVAEAPVAKPAPVAPAPVAEAPAADAASTCDVVREALLTGSPAKITSSMKALIADKTAPATAREYARYYTVRDKGQPSLQSMDESLITMSCT